MSTVQVEIVTPERKVYEGEARMVIARGVEGELGILRGHVPLVTPLRVSVLRLQEADSEKKIAISGGFLEVRPDKVTILAETAELPEEIDVARAEEAKKRAEQRLKEVSETDSAYQVHQQELDRAENRLRVAQGK